MNIWDRMWESHPSRSRSKCHFLLEALLDFPTKKNHPFFVIPQHLSLTSTHLLCFVWELFEHITSPSLNCKCFRAAVPNLFGTRDRFHGRQFFHGPGNGGDGSGRNESDGEQWGAADEASLPRPPLTSCCVARFLTGQGLVLVHGPGVGDPCFREWRPS